MSLLKKKKSPTEKMVDKTRDVAKKARKAVSEAATDKGTLAKGAAAAGIAAATAVGAAAVWKARSRTDGDGTRLDLVSDGNGSWELRAEDREDVLQRHDTKREAVSAARAYAREHSPSVLAIHREDGEIAREHSYADA